MSDMGYSYKKLDAPEEELELHHLSSKSPTLSTGDQISAEERPHRSFILRNLRNPRVIAATMLSLALALVAIGLVRSAVLEPRATANATNVPQYFQTTPELFAGNHQFLDRKGRDS